MRQNDDSHSLEQGNLSLSNIYGKNSCDRDFPKESGLRNEIGLWRIARDSRDKAR